MGDERVVQLRKYARWLARGRRNVGAAIITAAADHIEELTAENERLRKALDRITKETSDGE